jgi:hypothetical protein
MNTRENMIKIATYYSTHDESCCVVSEACYHSERIGQYEFENAYERAVYQYLKNYMTDDVCDALRIVNDFALECSRIEREEHEQVNAIYSEIERGERIKSIENEMVRMRKELLILKGGKL